MALNKDVRKASKEMDGQVGYNYQEYYKANKLGRKNVGLAAESAAIGAQYGSPLGPLGSLTGAGIGYLVGGTKAMRQSKRDYLDYVEGLENPEQQPIVYGNQGYPLLIPDTTQTTDQTNLYSYRMKNGGLNKYTTINVEKGELLVDQQTGEVLEDYMDKPEHPDGKYNVDLRGFTKAKMGTVVIPVKYRKKYLSDGADRMSIIKEVIANSGTGAKAQNGTMSTVSPPTTTDFSEYMYTQQLPQGQDAVGSTQTGFKSGGLNSAGWAGAPQTVLGVIQYTQAKKGLEALEKQPLPVYETQTPGELGRAYYGAQQRSELARKQARTGLSADEMAAYKANVAQASNLAYQRGIQQAGGSLSQAIRSGITSQNVGALNQLAVQDAQLKRMREQQADRTAQYVDQLGAQIARLKTNQQNMNTQYMQNRRLMTEQAYGRGLSSGMTNIASGSSSMIAGGLNNANQGISMLSGLGA